MLSIFLLLANFAHADLVDSRVVLARSAEGPAILEVRSADTLEFMMCRRLDQTITATLKSCRRLGPALSNSPETAAQLEQQLSSQVMELAAETSVISRRKFWRLRNVLIAGAAGIGAAAGAVGFASGAVVTDTMVVPALIGGFAVAMTVLNRVDKYQAPRAESRTVLLDQLNDHQVLTAREETPILGDFTTSDENSADYVFKKFAAALKRAVTIVRR